MSPFLLTTPGHPSHHLFTHFHPSLHLGRIQHHTRRQRLPLCVIFSTTRDGRVCLSVLTSPLHKMAVFASFGHIEHYTMWQCLPLWVILNIIQEGFAPFLNFTVIQRPVSASSCRIQHNTRRLCWPLLLSFSNILPSDVIKPRRVGRPHGLTLTWWGCCG